MESLCDGTTSLAVSSATSAGGVGSVAVADACEDEDLAGPRRESSNSDDSDSESARLDAMERVVEQSGVVKALVTRYFAPRRLELEACCNPRDSEKVYAAECRAVGSCSSASWTTSVFTAEGDDATLMDGDDAVSELCDDDGARVAAEALLASLCARAPQMVSSQILELCDFSTAAAADPAGDADPLQRAVRVDASLRALGVVAPLLPRAAATPLHRGEQRCATTACTGTYPDRALDLGQLWLFRVEPVLRSTASSLTDACSLPEVLLRSRALWLAARFRRWLCDDAQPLSAALVQALAHAAHPDARLALQAVDALCALFETVLERKRARLRRAVASRRCAVLANDARAGTAGGEHPHHLRAVSSQACDTNATQLELVTLAAAQAATRAVALSQRLQQPEGAVRCLQCVSLCVEVAGLDLATGEDDADEDEENDDDPVDSFLESADLSGSGFAASLELAAARYYGSPASAHLRAGVD